jgi:hypothetical protein
LKGLSPPIPPEPRRRQDTSGSRSSTQINGWIGREAFGSLWVVQRLIDSKFAGGNSGTGRRSILINDRRSGHRRRAGSRQ